MSVRAKFQVQKVSKLHWSSGHTEVTLSAVCDDGIEENRRFSKATPSGSITMLIDNPPASDQLQIGKYFYVDFTEVPQ